jgi:flagellin-specific chaperone FliS
MTALFESKEELKVFVLDIIETSPLSGRVDKLTERVDKLTERVDELHEMLKAERAAGEERDHKLNVIYDGVLALLAEAEKRQKLADKVDNYKQDADLTRTMLRSHEENKKVHVTPRRGRPKRIREAETEE